MTTLRRNTDPILEYRIHPQPLLSAFARAVAIASLCIAFAVLAFPTFWMLATGLMHSVTARPGPLPGFFQNPLLLSIPLLATYALPSFGILLGASSLALRCTHPALVLLGILSNIAGLVAAVFA